MRKALLFILPQLFAAASLCAQTLVPAGTRHARMPKYDVPGRVTVASEPSESDIYNVSMLVAEDFGKITEGSETAPGDSAFDGFIPSELTASPEWSAYYVYPAGGCLLIDRARNTNANLCSPVLDVPQTDVPVTVSFRARLATKKTDRDWVEVYMVDATDPTDVFTHYNDYAYVYDEWKEYTFVFTKKRPGSRYFFQFSGYDAPVLVDDIEIKMLTPKLAAPVATEFTDFTNTGFTANWTPVEGADSYRVSLFTINKDRDKTRNYIARDLAVDGCSHAFTGLNTPVTTYYYTVRAVKGTQLSPESNAAKVQSLTVPANISFAPAGTDSVKVSWDAVEGAEYYVVDAYRAHEAKADETYVLSQENFDKLVCDGTYLSPEVPYQYQEELDEWTDQPGWIAQCPLHINGSYGLAGYYGTTSDVLVFLESPLMDLSAAGGKVKVSVDLYGQKTDVNDLCTMTFRTMRYFTEDGREKLETTDNDITGKIPEEWTHYETALGGGTRQSVVELVANGGAIYIDNLCLSQDLKAGESVRVPYSNSRSETNEVTLPVSDLLRGSDIVVRVQAVREIWDEMHYSVNEYIRSPYSAECSYALAATGISGVTADAPQVRVSAAGGRVTVVNPTGADVAIYDLSGRLMASDRSGARLAVIPFAATGVYVVRVAGEAVKVKL